MAKVSCDLMRTFCIILGLEMDLSAENSLESVMKAGN